MKTLILLLVFSSSAMSQMSLMYNDIGGKELEYFIFDEYIQWFVIYSRRPGGVIIRK